MVGCTPSVINVSVNIRSVGVERFVARKVLGRWEQVGSKWRDGGGQLRRSSERGAETNARRPT